MLLDSHGHDGRVFDADEIARALAHIEEQWPRLMRDQPNDSGTIIGLPHPYIVPSVEAERGFAFNELYYWDTHFIITSLLRTGRYELAEGLLENLIYLAKRFGIIPNANRFYFSSRSQPPFLTSIIFAIYETCDKSESWLRERMTVAEHEYRNVWTASVQPNIRNVHKGLSRYYDINVLDDLAEAESGWDMTSRFDGRCLAHIPVCLNSLLYKYETDLARAYEIFGETDTSEVWQGKAALRKETMERELWRDEHQFFFDLDYREGKHSEVWSLAGFYPLWAGLASEENAAQIVSKLDHFLYEGGLSATASPHEQHDERDLPKQWAYPNGWAPLHFLVVEGLQRYGFEHEARLIARRWLTTALDYFLAHGVFREAYNVVSPKDKPEEGVYPAQIGFAWTNAVFVELAHSYLTPEELALVNV